MPAFVLSEGRQFRDRYPWLDPPPSPLISLPVILRGLYSLTKFFIFRNSYLLLINWCFYLSIITFNIVLAYAVQQSKSSSYVSSASLSSHPSRPSQSPELNSQQLPTSYPFFTWSCMYISAPLCPTLLHPQVREPKFWSIWALSATDSCFLGNPG